MFGRWMNRVVKWMGIKKIEIREHVFFAHFFAAQSQLIATFFFLISGNINIITIIVAKFCFFYYLKMDVAKIHHTYTHTHLWIYLLLKITGPQQLKLGQKCHLDRLPTTKKNNNNNNNNNDLTLESNLIIW